MIDWTKFKTFGGDPDNPWITIITLTSRGLILLPTRLIQKLFPDQKELFAQVLYRAEDSVLAIRFFRQDGEGLFKVTRAKSNWRITAKSALLFYRIDLSRTRTFLTRVELGDSAEPPALLLDTTQPWREK